jgi:hypothetical protein
VFLVTDLADFQLNSGIVQLPFLSERLFLKSIVDMLSRFDLDLQEKVRLELLPVPIILNMLVLLHNNIVILPKSLIFWKLVILAVHD